MNKQIIGLRVRKLREYRNFTQAFMADQLNIKQNTYSKLETGQIRLSNERLAQIARLLDVPLEKLTDNDFELLNPGIAVSPDSNQASRIEALVLSMKSEIAVLKNQNEDLISLFSKLSTGNQRQIE